MRGRLLVVIASAFAVFLMHQGAVGVAAAAPMAMPEHSMAGNATSAQSMPTQLMSGHDTTASPTTDGCALGHHCVFVRAAQVVLAAVALIGILALAIVNDIAGMCVRRLRFIAERPPPWTIPTLTSLSVLRR